MTDKEQIMIDGVDVSRCKGYYFSPTGYHSCSSIPQINELAYEQDTLCEQNPNCYFKQLARKTQECEELRKTVLTRCPECGSEYLTPAGLVLFMEADHYRRAFEEIEEMASNPMCKRQDILDIINKAKGEMNG